MKGNTVKKVVYYILPIIAALLAVGFMLDSNKRKVWYMIKVRILFKNSKIACCSQVCESSGPYFGKCRTYMIDVKK